MQRSVFSRATRLVTPITCLVILVFLAGAPVFGSALEQAQKLIDAGDDRGAKRVLEKAAEDSEVDAETLLLLTRTCNRLEEYDDGIRYGKRAVQQLPDNSDAHYRYAEALRIKMQKVSKIRAMGSVGPYKNSLVRAIELDPKNVEARREQIGFLMHAPGMVGGDKDAARERIDELMSIDWRVAMTLRAELETTEEDLETARATYEELLAKHPDDTESRYQLAFLLQRLERFREAERQFAMVAEDPEPVYAFNALYQMGRTRVLGRFEAQQAVELFRRFIDDCSDDLPGVPSKSSAYWRLGNAYQQLDRRDDARRAYERALDLDDDNDQARKALKALPSG